MWFTNVRNTTWVIIDRATWRDPILGRPLNSQHPRGASVRQIVGHVYSNFNIESAFGDASNRDDKVLKHTSATEGDEYIQMHKYG